MTLSFAFGNALSVSFLYFMPVLFHISQKIYRLYLYFFEDNEKKYIFVVLTK